jgi:hypothetical protein
MVITTTKVKGIEARRSKKAKKIVSQEARDNMRLGQMRRQARRREEKAAESNHWAATSLSAAAVSPATETSFVVSSIIARKEQALKTIGDCDIALDVWKRLGL